MSQRVSLLPRISVVLAGACLLTGCLVTSSGSTSSSNRVWTPNEYGDVCSIAIPPSEPSCFLIAGSYGGFKSNSEFRSCRQSLIEFTEALDTYFDCTESEVSSLFGDLMREVASTYDCFADYFSNRDTGNPEQQCGLVERPRFPKQFAANGIEYNFGIPRCVIAEAEFSRPPTNLASLLSCKDDVEVFLGGGLLSGGLFVEPAQDQYEEFVDNLRWDLNRKAEAAIERFNCYADNRPYCL